MISKPKLKLTLKSKGNIQDVLMSPLIKDHRKHDTIFILYVIKNFTLLREKFDSKLKPKHLIMKTNTHRHLHFLGNKTDEMTPGFINHCIWKIICNYLHISNSAIMESQLKLFFKNNFQNSHCGALETNPISTHEDVGLVPGLGKWVP